MTEREGAQGKGEWCPMFHPHHDGYVLLCGASLLPPVST